MLFSYRYRKYTTYGKHYFKLTLTLFQKFMEDTPIAKVLFTYCVSRLTCLNEHNFPCGMSCIDYTFRINQLNKKQYRPICQNFFY